MRPLAVVVVDVDAEDAFEVTPIQDQQPVQALGAHGSDEALRDRVRLRRSHRRLYDPDALAVEDLIERAAVLAVAVADQEADAPIAEGETEVARLLLDNPGSAGIRRAAGEPDAPARMRDEEDVVAAQKPARDREEAAGDDARCLPAKELAPVRACASRRWLQPCPGEQTADARRRDAESELAQLAADPAMTPARILACEPQHQLPHLKRQRRPPAPCRRLPPLPSHERQRSSVLGVTRRRLRDRRGR